MGNQIKCRKANFWLEDGILFCEFKIKEYKNEFSEDFIEDYLNAITTLSNGRYFPLLVDLRQLNSYYAFSVLKILANNPKLKSAILSKSFMVNSYLAQFVLILLKGAHFSVIPNRIFISYEKAVQYSLKTYYNFNA